MTGTALDRIRRLYHRTTARTIETDLQEAITLLKTLPDEPARAAAAVYMDGLSQMRSEWRMEEAQRRRSSRTTGARKATTRRPTARKGK